MTTKHNVTGATYYTYLYTGECGATDPGVITPTISIPENVIFLVALTPLIPFMVAWLKERKEKMLALELHK